MTTAIETMTQAELDAMPVIHHAGRHGTPQPTRAGEWLEESVKLGSRLTDAEAEQLSAYSGYRIENSLFNDHSGFVLDDADGNVLHVYLDDPFEADQS